MDSMQRAVTTIFDLCKNPRWRPAAILKKENHLISAVVSDIFTKFGVLLDIVSPHRPLCHFWTTTKSKMAAGAILKKRKIAKSRLPFEMSSQIL